MADGNRYFMLLKEKRFVYICVGGGRVDLIEKLKIEYLFPILALSSYVASTDLRLS